MTAVRATEVPAAVRRKALVAGADRWLAGLPALVAGLARDWSIAVGPAYGDATVLMREDPVELLRGDPRERSRRLAALTGRAEPAIWEWGVVERVSTGLVCTRIGLPVGRQMLAAADRVAGG